MPAKASIPLLVSLLLLAAACHKSEEPASPSQASEPPPAASPAAPPPVAAATPEPSAVTPTPLTPEVLASQETNWPGVIAEVIEFRRKGNTLTALVRLRNHGTSDPEPDIKYSETYLMDLTAGKKYEVLQDEKGTYIAALRSGWTDRWYERLSPDQAQTIWMKFPAPPADVKSITLQIPGAPPFEDLPIQEP
jgi:hypothetical protein